MFKAIFVTDQHFRYKTPIKRNDEILESLLKKMKWVYDYAVKHKIKNIIHGGDIFQTPSVNDYVANRVIELISRYKTSQKNYYIIGNHDLIGGSIKNRNYCKIGMLEHYSHFFHLGCVEFEDCYLCGYDFKKEKECPEMIDPRIDFSLKDNKKPVIAVVHSMIVDSGQILIMGKIKTVHWNSLITSADAVLSGHYHPGFGKKTNSFGTVFVNPGSIARLEASKTELKRKPKVALIKVKNKKIFVELLTIPHKKDVFKSEELGEEHKRSEERKRFIEALENLKDEELMAGNILKILKNIKKDFSREWEKCSSKVIKMCCQRIKDIQDERCS